MRIALYSRQLKPDDIPFVQTVVAMLQKSGIDCLLYDLLHRELQQQLQEIQTAMPTFDSHDSLSGRADFLFSIGGDGTLLNTITLVQDLNIPVLGINSGRLGFLTDVHKDEFTTQLLTALQSGNFTLDSRTILRADSNRPALFADAPYALNEFTIHKLDTSAMITVHTYVDGQFLNSYWADGIIVSTPTGSTAYSLSCGGPIVYPSSQTFIITPVAPHNLNVRPIVIPDDKTISFKVEGRGDAFLCTLDSRYETIDHHYQIQVSKERFMLQLVRLSGNDFFSTIRNKLMWGLDTRN